MREHHSSLKAIILVVILIFSTLAAFAQKSKSRVSEQVDTIVGESVLPRTAVVPFRDTIFYIYGHLGSFTSDQRAAAIENRIRSLESDLTFQKDSLKLVDHNGYLNIVYKREVLVSIDTVQAEHIGKSRTELAKLYKTSLISAIDKEREETSWQRILLQLGGVIGVILGVVFSLRVINILLRRLKYLIARRRSKFNRGFFEILGTNRGVQVFLVLAKLLRFLLIITILYLGVYLLFQIFPNTESLSNDLLSYVTVPLKSIIKSIINYLPKLMVIIVIVVIFRYVTKMLRSIAEKTAEKKLVFKGFYPDWAFPTYNIVRVVLFCFMFIFIFPYLPKSDSQIFQGVSVFIGLIFSLGSTSVIGNLVAGLVITYMRPFTLGDRIKMGEVTGDVIEKTALVTRIKTPKNEVITIPNSNVMSAHTINYTLSAQKYGLILYTTVAVGYEVPWKKVNESLMEVARRTSDLSPYQKPFIHQEALSDFYLEYQLNVYIENASLMSRIYSDLKQNVLDVFAEEGIELLAPHYRVNKEVDHIDTVFNQKERDQVKEKKDI